MSSRTGKHFKGDKDLIIHDKTGRVIYLYYFTTCESVPPVCFRLHKPVYDTLASCPQTVCVFFYLQILISWNRFARSLKEAFELYWETKQVRTRE